jgi:cation:H+ antiporter
MPLKVDAPTPPPDVLPAEPDPPTAVTPRRRRTLSLAGVPLFQALDLGVWLLVLIFFGASALLGGGAIVPSLAGALAIIVIMFVVGAAVELVIESLRDVRGLGTLVGFITNGPEALCLTVGLISGDILFAASTPLGSNFMNPVMLIVAALLTGCFRTTLRTRPGYTLVCILLTATLAGSFFFIPERSYQVWMGIALPVTVILFWRRPPETAEAGADAGGLRRVWFLPSLAVLVLAGYLLDPAVSYTALQSHAPKGVIGFFVLSTLTSWPEFKSCLSLNRRRRYLCSVLNITVSNITNIWLALAGVGIHLLLR